MNKSRDIWSIFLILFALFTLRLIFIIIIIIIYQNNIYKMGKIFFYINLFNYFLISRINIYNLGNKINFM